MSVSMSVAKKPWNIIWDCHQEVAKFETDLVGRL